MTDPSLPRVRRAFVGGVAAAALLFASLLVIVPLLTQQTLPLSPLIIAGGATIGVLLIITIEQRARATLRYDQYRLARVAHQLLTPLTTLENTLQELAAHAAALPVDVRLTVHRMETKTTVLLENIRDIFLLLQAHSGSLVRERRTYDICALVREAVGRVRPLAHARNVELIEQHHCHHAPVRVDRQLTLIALLHVLENAIVYNLTPGLVNVTVQVSGESASVIIQDRGIGIAKADQETIWEPFARGRQAQRYDSDGIGVGLPLSRHIIAEQGGELLLTPRSGTIGTQVEIRLPLATKA